MLKQVIDEKIKQYQELLNEYFEKLDLSNESNESIVYLINMAINDLETIFYIYTQQLKDKEKTNDKQSN